MTTKYDEGQELNEGNRRQVVVRENEVTIPGITERFYNSEGKVVGLSILVEQGTIPVTGEQYAEWYRKSKRDIG